MNIVFLVLSRGKSEVYLGFDVYVGIEAGL